MRRFHFYHADTGVLHSNCLSIDAPDAERAAALNCPPGHLVVEGHLDPLSQRVDVSVPPQMITVPGHNGTKEKRTVHQVIDYQPPAPSSDHEWNTETKRWMLGAAAITKAQAREAARVRIAALEQSQHAIVRDLLLGGLAARPRLQAIADEIAALESTL